MTIVPKPVAVISGVTVPGGRTHTIVQHLNSAVRRWLIWFDMIVYLSTKFVILKARSASVQVVHNQQNKIEQPLRVRTHAVLLLTLTS